LLLVACTFDNPGQKRTWQMLFMWAYGRYEVMKKPLAPANFTEPQLGCLNWDTEAGHKLPYFVV
jgi:hypothetical protein